MPTQARSAYGTILKIGATTVPELVSITDVGSRADLIDASAHDGSGYSTQIPTLKRNNPIRALMNYVPTNATQALLKTQYDNGTSTAYSVVLPGANTPTWAFNAFVTQWQLGALGVASVPQLDVILQPDGPITITTT